MADYLSRMDFIVLDELGYLPFAQSGGQLLFHLVSLLAAAARRLTVAPESVSNEQIARLAAAGVIVSLGYSDADFATAAA